MQRGPHPGMHGILERGRLLIRPCNPIIAADAARGTSERVVMGLVCVGGQKSGLLKWPMVGSTPLLRASSCVI